MNNQQQAQINAMSGSPREYQDNVKCFISFGHLFGGLVGPTLAMTYCIGGKPCLSADAVFAQALKSNVFRFKWLETSATSCTLKVWRIDLGEGDERCELTETLTFEECKAANPQIARNPSWKRFPKQMLMARLKTHCARAIMPELTGGLYSASEIDDSPAVISQEFGEQIQTPPQPQPVESTPPQPQPVESTPPQPQPMESTKIKMSLTAAKDASGLLDMLTGQGVIDNTTASMSFKTIETLYKQFFDKEEDRLKFARLCLEGRRHFDLAVSLGSLSIILDDMAKWDQLPKMKEPLALELAASFGFDNDPWSYFGAIFHDISKDKELFAIKRIDKELH